VKISGLLNISGNEWRICGTQNYLKREVKTVTVEGETYSKTVCSDSIFDYDQDFESTEKSHYWRLLEFKEYDFLGIETRKIWDYQGWEYGGALHKICSNCQIYSQNWYAQSNGFLCEKGFFGDKILSATTEREYFFPITEIQDLFTLEGNVKVNVFGYGSGHGFFVDVSIQTFLEFDFSKWPKHKKNRYALLIPEIDSAKTFFTEDQKLIISHRLFQSLINANENGN
jgi:hypothetical protein